MFDLSRKLEVDLGTLKEILLGQIRLLMNAMVIYKFMKS